MMNFKVINFFKRIVKKIPMERVLSFILGIVFALFIVTPVYIIKKQIAANKSINKNNTIQATEVIVLEEE